MLVVRTGKGGMPHPRYPAELIRTLADGGNTTARFEVLQRDTDERKPAYLYVLDNIAARRDIERWVAYRVHTAGANK